MSTQSSIPLATAKKIADKICQEIWPYCSKVEIAGSIRRRRPYCGDIDLVVLPKPGMLADLQARFKRNAVAETEGPQNAIYRLTNGVQLDVFFAWETDDFFRGRQTNWGSLLICRTGARKPPGTPTLASSSWSGAPPSPAPPRKTSSAPWPSTSSPPKSGKDDQNSPPPNPA